ncbi:13773_t:CDS:2, partial [Acaulospora colombiana]
MSAAKHADLLFCKEQESGGSDLARYCDTLGIPYVQFRTFKEVLPVVKSIVLGEKKVEEVLGKAPTISRSIHVPVLSRISLPLLYETFFTDTTVKKNFFVIAAPRPVNVLKPQINAIAAAASRALSGLTSHHGDAHPDSSSSLLALPPTFSPSSKPSVLTVGSNFTTTPDVTPISSNTPSEVDPTESRDHVFTSDTEDEADMTSSVKSAHEDDEEVVIATATTAAVAP